MGQTRIARRICTSQSAIFCEPNPSLPSLARLAHTRAMTDRSRTEPTRATADEMLAALGRAHDIVAALLDEAARSRLDGVGVELPANEPADGADAAALIDELGSIVRELMAAGLRFSIPRAEGRELHVPDREEREVMEKLFEISSDEELMRPLVQDAANAELRSALDRFRAAHERMVLAERVSAAMETLMRDLVALRASYSDHVLAGVLGSWGVSVR